jgi:3'(2'), 5'-bisphosphate nucleotidase
MTSGWQDDDALAEIFTALALQAGAVIMRIRAADPRARVKSDASPVCDADYFGEEVFLTGLSRLVPHLPVVAEERCAVGDVPAIGGGPFILVDALDGTKEFLQRRDSFTVNAALIRDGAPVAGAVYAPARGQLFLAGSGAWTFAAGPGSKPPPRTEWRALHTRPMPGQGLIAALSRDHLDAETRRYLGRLPVKQIVTMGSSLKFCLIADGRADIYPRFSRTMEWDIAAGDAVLRRAGGMVADLAGAPFVYGKEANAFFNGPFVAWGDPNAAAAFSPPPEGRR